MTKPTIHTNGTRASDLTDAYCAAMLAVRAAMAKVSESCPNSRDYYPQGGNAYAEARAEHFSRLDRLDSVARELEQLAEHCAGF